MCFCKDGGETSALADCGDAERLGPTLRQTGSHQTGFVFSCSSVTSGFLASALWGGVVGMWTWEQDQVERLYLHLSPRILQSEWVEVVWGS